MCRAGQYGGPVPNITINTNNTGQQAAAELGNAGTPLQPDGNYPYSSFGYDQFSWFLNDIGRVDRGRTPWVIVAWHQPPYNSYSTHYKEFECSRQAIEPILYQNGVDIVMHGHVHAYERTFPVNNYAVDQCGMRWITIGDGGNIEGLYKTFASQNGTCYCSAQTSSGSSNGCPCLDVTPSTVPQARPGGACSPSCHPTARVSPPDPNVPWPSKVPRVHAPSAAQQVCLALLDLTPRSTPRTHPQRGLCHAEAMPECAVPHGSLLWPHLGSHLG